MVRWWKRGTMTKRTTSISRYPKKKLDWVM
jgi:hypothetical protein